MTDPLVPLADRIALREDEAAAMLGISESELGRLRREGKIPRIAGVGRVVLYSPAALRRWALERSGYADPAEVDGAEDQDADALQTSVQMARFRAWNLWTVDPQVTGSTPVGHPNSPRARGVRGCLQMPRNEPQSVQRSVQPAQKGKQP
jgi:hypothetical protein